MHHSDEASYGTAMSLLSDVRRMCSREHALFAQSGSVFRIALTRPGSAVVESPQRLRPAPDGARGIDLTERPVLRALVGTLLIGVLLGVCGGIVALRPPAVLRDLSPIPPNLTVAIPWTGDDQAAFQRVVAEFVETTNARVRVVASSGTQSIEESIAAGSPPDVAIVSQPGVLARLVGMRAVQPLDRATRQLVDENYSPIWRETASIDGRLYGVWFRAVNKSSVWYRAKTFADARLRVPSSLDELREAANALRRGGVSPFALGAADGGKITDWFENIYLASAGPELYDRLARREIPWTDSSVARALEILAQLLSEDTLPGGINGALATTFDRAVTQVFGADPSAAMVLAGYSMVERIAGLTTGPLGVDARFFDFPSVGGSQPAVVAAGELAVLLKDTKEGRSLIKFLATSDAAEVWARSGGILSPNIAALGSYPDETSRRLAAELAVRTVRIDLSDLAPVACGATPGQGMWRIFQDFLRNPSSLQQTAQRLEDCHAVAS